MSEFNLPQGWTRVRLRHLLSPNPSGEEIRRIGGEGEVSFFSMEMIGENGELDSSETRDFEKVSNGYSRFLEGDVVVAKITPCFENGKGALIRGTLTGVGFGTTELHVLRPSPRVDGQFLRYVTADPRFRMLGEGAMIGAAGQKRVPETFIRDYVVAVPPIKEQEAIAADLDRETERIDAPIAAKRELVACLDEKRQALVTRGITRGLDPDVPMRDSGVPWIGDVPMHWDIERGRWLFTERDEKSRDGDEEMLTVSHLTGVTKRSEKDVNMFEANSTVGYKIVYPGDLAINTLWAWMGAMGTSPHHGIVSPAYHVYEPGPRLMSSYVDALVRTDRFVREVTRYSKGVWSSRLRLYPAEFFDVLFPVPPVDEQRAITAEIERQSSRLDVVARETRRSIDLLQERRAGLISATLTGQRRVF